MERKLGGFLLTALGVMGLILADVNLLQLISNQSYGNDLYNVGSGGRDALAVFGFGISGLALTFLGIKLLRRPTSV